MIKKRYLVALGAFSAALAACGSTMKDPGNKSAGSGANGATPGSGGSSGSSGNKATGGSSGNTPGTGGSGNNGTGGGNATGGSSGNGGTSGNGGSSGSAGGGAITCAPGVPATSAVPRMLNRQYDAAIRDLLGVTTLGTDGNPPSAGLQADFDGPMNAEAWRLYQQTGAALAKAVMADATAKGKFMTCDPAAANCLTDTVKAFGRKAFRRVVDDAEAQNIVMKLSSTTPAGTPAEIAEAILYTFLVSPSFLLVPELSGTPGADGTIPLSSYEVAAKLSFLLWNSVPDDELNAAADAGTLTTKDQILAQAQRMIMVRDKTAPMISQFHRVYWAGDNGNATAHWWKIDHDGNSLYNSALKASVYRAELDKFFEEVVYTGGSFKDLLLSPIAFVNKANAPIYGLDPNMYTDTLTKATLDPAQRPGFMTRVGFLSSFAHPDSTSPILRGAYITINFIGVNPGAPDPNARNVTITDNYSTERDYVVALTSSGASCQGCHIPYVNPPGFNLEHYDSIGKWQDTDPRGGTIDSSSDVHFTSDGPTQKINNAQELMTQIAQTPAAIASYAQQWVAFATGRNPNPGDQCIADQLNTKLSADGYSVLALLGDLTQADSFRLRVKETP